ncbi:STAS domain-containing protein [Embleya hyalina]|uniref:STAS domain-containing protein n=1 Tax=Embleya hyalina TaxID=516124 RepID=A0A401YM92_9ACTN|nr:STAS domain-containing protein [Embleya hyalina]GCD95707.1 hypothetical protein EHYA_03390 [Embleya hyalina]
MVYADGVLRVERVGPPSVVRLAGEVDADNCVHVRSVLDAQRVGCAGDVCVDAAFLEFIDVAGVRTLVETAGRMPSGLSVVVRSAPVELCDLVSLAGWDGAPGLVLERTVRR